ncbi:MAG: hypothetical protein OXT65_04775 [Alphaproteobacteria bacterium]|nr:hypothetical protein [Alphaproteobacteria bacterium]
MAAIVDPLPKPLKKFINTGIIDNWFRGAANLVPQKASGTGLPSLAADFNEHTLDTRDLDGITHKDIQRTKGFKQLIAACSRQNVRLDLTDNGDGELKICFKAEESFRHSTVFGRSSDSCFPGIFCEGLEG